MPLCFRLPLAAPLLTLAGVLLGSCSSPSPATTETAPQAAVPAQASVQFPFGGKVDSLNGIAGHTFGQPLSAFPKMQLEPPLPGQLTRTYAYEGSAGWFGQHPKQVRVQLYYFLNGKFCRFLALGDPTVLRPEATSLFGPGQAAGKDRLLWEGSQVRAAYREKASGMEMEGTLDVASKALEAEEAAQANAQFEAENAQ